MGNNTSQGIMLVGDIKAVVKQASMTYIHTYITYIHTYIHTYNTRNRIRNHLHNHDGNVFYLRLLGTSDYFWREIIAKLMQ